MRCSRKCAMPDLPGCSSARPHLYHTIWVTAGLWWLGMTTTSSPFASVKVSGWNNAASAKEVEAAKRATVRATTSGNSTQREGIKSPNLASSADPRTKARRAGAPPSFPSRPARAGLEQASVALALDDRLVLGFEDAVQPAGVGLLRSWLVGRALHQIVGEGLLLAGERLGLLVDLLADVG